MGPRSRSWNEVYDIKLTNHVDDRDWIGAAWHQEQNDPPACVLAHSHSSHPGAHPHQIQVSSRMASFSESPARGLRHFLLSSLKKLPSPSPSSLLLKQLFYAYACRRVSLRSCVRCAS